MSPHITHESASNKKSLLSRRTNQNIFPPWPWRSREFLICNMSQKYSLPSFLLRFCSPPTSPRLSLSPTLPFPRSVFFTPFCYKTHGILGLLHSESSRDSKGAVPSTSPTALLGFTDCGQIDDGVEVEDMNSPGKNLYSLISGVLSIANFKFPFNPACTQNSLKRCERKLLFFFQRHKTI